MSDTPRDILTVETREDLVHIRRAANATWSPEKLVALRDAVENVVNTGKNARLRMSAARTLTAINKLCLEAFIHVHNVELKTLDKQMPDKHELAGPGGGPMSVAIIGQEEARKALLSDPDYLESRERRLLAASKGGSNNGHANGNGHA